MKNRFLLLCILFLLPRPLRCETTPLTLIQKIPLPGVEGRIDHLSLDSIRQLLFVPALENNTIEVVELKKGWKVRTLTGLHEPQGVLFINEMDRLIVANGGDGAVDIFDGASLKHLGGVSFSGDADNMRYNASNKMVYVGYAEGGLGVIDPSTMKLTADLHFGSHPESFQIDNSGKIFVNLPPDKIGVIDQRNGNSITNWSLLGHGVASNFPMDLDEADHRLFIGTRTPAKLIVLNSDSGELIQKIDTVSDADDIFYDARRKRVYVSGGGGSISIFGQVDANHYRLLTNFPTAAGARTSLFAPELNRLYLGVPHRGNQPAEIRVYQVGP